MSCDKCESCKHSFEKKACSSNPICPPISTLFLGLTEACNSRCRYCVPKGTKIFTNEFEYKNIEDIQIGDIILGFDETVNKNKKRQIKPSEVIQLFQHDDEIIEITLEDNLKLQVTKNHSLLTNHGSTNQSWREAGKFKVGQKIMTFPYIPNEKCNINDINYIIGYCISVMMGDGSFKIYQYKEHNFRDDVRIRLAVKDIEILERMKKYFNILNINYNLRDFKISTKYDLNVEAIFSNSKDSYNKIISLINDNFRKNKTFEYYCGFLAGIYDAEGSIDKRSCAIRICNSNIEILDEIKDGLNVLGIEHITEKTNKTNKQTYNVRIVSKKIIKDNIKFLQIVQPSIVRKGLINFYNKSYLIAQKIVSIESKGITTVYNIATTTRTYIANNFAVHNCFVKQNPSQMSYEMAFEGINWVGRQTEKERIQINFFGGEPLLRWNDIIVPIVLYGKQKYGARINFSMTTNALALDEEKLEFMKKYGIGMLLSFDGCKECQDYNRPTPNGVSSYDIVAPKIPTILKYYPRMTMRQTLYQPTVHTFYENHKLAVDLGFTNVHCAIDAFDTWTEESLNILKEQLIKVADLYISLVKQGKDIMIDPLFRHFGYIKRIETNTHNTRTENANRFGHGKCGIGANNSVILSTEGNFYTCQETYTNEDIRDFFYVGNLKEGIDNKRRLEIVGTFNPLQITSNGMDCKECHINTICDGFCLIRNHNVNGNFNIVPVCVCKYENLLYETALYIREKLKDNEQFKKRFGF